MQRRLFKSVDLDRIERAYLASLRIAILAVATLCLLGAIGFGANALWRVFVSTTVAVEPVQITGTQVAAALKEAAPEQASRDGNDQIPAFVRQAHAQWARDVFPKYYAIYLKASNAYKKPEDVTLNSQQLMDALGYDLRSYADNGIKAQTFINNPDYQRQALAAVAAAVGEPSVVLQLSEYKSVGKTAKSCSTTYRSQRVWDSYSTACYNWYLEPQGCEVTRSVPVEVCVAAYPEGIVSPRVAFGRADEEFFRLWTDRNAQVQAEAQAARDEREATRAQIVPSLLLALQILAAFLVVMFFFLVVAIERHLRNGGILVPVGPAPPESDASEPASESADPAEEKARNRGPIWSRRK